MVPRRAYDEVERKGGIERAVDSQRLVYLVPCRHDNKDIHIAIGVRVTVCMGSEQDYHVRPKELGELPGESANQPHRDICAAIPAGGRGLQSCTSLGDHGSILLNAWFATKRLGHHLARPHRPQLGFDD